MNERLQKVIDHPLHKYRGVEDIQSKDGKGKITVTVSETIVNPVGSFHGTSTIVLFTIELDEHLIGSYFQIL